MNMAKLLNESPKESDPAPRLPQLMMYTIFGWNHRSRMVGGGSHPGTLLLASRKAAKALSLWYAEYQVLVESHDDTLKWNSATSTNGQNCEVILDYRNNVSLSRQIPTSPSCPIPQNGLLLKDLHLQSESSHEPVVIGSFCVEKSSWVVYGNMKKDCPESSESHYKHPVSIILTCPLVGSINDLPVEILQLCFSFLLGKRDINDEDLLTLARVCNWWRLALDYHRALAQRPDFGWGESLAELLHKATLPIPLAVFACEGLRTVFIDQSMCAAMRPGDVWTSLETLFRLSKLEKIDITGPLSFSRLPSNPQRGRLWKSGEGRHELRDLRLRWGKTTGVEGESRWSSDDLLGLMSHGVDTMSWCAFEGVDFASKPASQGTIKPTRYLDLIDCRLRNESFPWLLKLKPSNYFHLYVERCVGPGRMSITDVAELFPESGKLTKLTVLLWPWADFLLEEKLVDWWIYKECRNQGIPLNFVLTYMPKITQLVIDSAYEELRAFSSPVDIPDIILEDHLPLELLELHYTSGLRGEDVIMIIDHAPLLFRFIVTLFFGEWTREEFESVRQRWNIRLQQPQENISGPLPLLEIFEGSSETEENWERRLGECWSDDEVREELERWENLHDLREFNRWKAQYS